MAFRKLVPHGCHSLSVVFTSDREVQALNKHYRNKDKPTDVLSFSQVEGDVGPLEADGELGDIVISVEAAQRQAREFDCAFDREIRRLLIHGLLHLCGFDHERVSARIAQRMRREERRIFKNFC